MFAHKFCEELNGVCMLVDANFSDIWQVYLDKKEFTLAKVHCQVYILLFEENLMVEFTDLINSILLLAIGLPIQAIDMFCFRNYYVL